MSCVVFARTKNSYLKFCQNVKGNSMKLATLRPNFKSASPIGLLTKTLEVSF